jgi:NADH-quinone oxidoreductase subunit A
MAQWVPLLVQFVIVLLITTSIVGISHMVGRPRQGSPVKTMPYESGIIPQVFVGPRISIKFYLVAMLFMIFDVEAASFYPWAVLLHHLKSFGLLEMASFLIVLAIGYAFVWKRGGFEWQENR